MAKDEDFFNDVDMAGLGLGVLAGDGAASHQGTRSKISPDRSGMGFELTCDSCGQRQYVVCSWDELLIVSCGFAPPGNAQSRPWGYDQHRGAVHPNTPCCACQRLDTMLHLTPDEAARHVRAGEQAQCISAAYIANAKQQIAQNFRR